ncbi:hypothetical protein [Nocardia sp. NBC_00403]|uniref:hypothetical protein n=1 Tax=Nocardia sp. NBC_00403 TaxID=2975990 RepID=UPI002E242323
MSFLVCARCGKRLTTPINLAAPSADRDTPGQPFMARGAYAVSWNKGFILHPDDVTGAARDPDPNRWVGCCGPDGTHGPNLVCSGCQTEIATRESDCWKPHFVATIPDETTLITSDSH